MALRRSQKRLLSISKSHYLQTKLEPYSTYAFFSSDGISLHTVGTDEQKLCRWEKQEKINKNQLKRKSSPSTVH